MDADTHGNVLAIRQELRPAMGQWAPGCAFCDRHGWTTCVLKMLIRAGFAETDRMT